MTKYVAGIAALVLLLFPSLADSPETLHDQVIVNTQRLSDLEQWRKSVDERLELLSTKETLQDVQMATMMEQFRAMVDSLSTIKILLGTLIVGFLGRLIWDVVGPREKGDPGRSRGEDD